MAQPMRIRAKLKGDEVEAKILVQHVMETGLRKGADGAKIPPNYIKTLIVKYDGKVVLESVMGIAVSKDPFLSFSFKGGAKGGKLSVTWVDNLDATRTDAVTVK